MAVDTRSLWQGLPFVWGQTDCIMSMCNHVLAMTGIDPAAPWRGTYDDEAGARAICENHGGVLGLVRYGMGQSGFAVGPIVDGAPVVADFGGCQIAGVVFRGRVGFMAERGLIETRANVLEAWAI